MKISSPALSQFLKNWLAEFGRAIEMFTGQQPSVVYIDTEAISIPRTASALWVKQVLSTESDFEIWIGAQEQTWMALGKALGDGPPDSLRSTYLEIINQAQQGAATVTSQGLKNAIRCGAPQTSTQASLDAGSFYISDLEIIGEEYPPLILAIQKTALKALEPSTPSSKQQVRGESPDQDAPDLTRVAGLSLPVSVSVGTNKIELGKVLWASSGSRISLAKDTSDLMELLVDGVGVARGELVVVKGNFGFRIRQIISQSQRISLCNG